MYCREANHKLNEFVDLELPEEQRQKVRWHLDDCERCRASHRSLVRLKRLVHTKIRRPPAAAGLANHILNTLPADAGRGKSLLRWVAAAVVALGLGSIVTVVSPEQDAHAAVVKSCMEDFLRNPPPQPLDVLPQEITRVRKMVEEETGLDLGALPWIQGARYVRSTHFQFRDIRGARVDFHYEGETVSVFVLPLEKLSYSESFLKVLAAEGHFCRCVEGNESTVFCLCSDKFSFNVVTTMGEETLENLLPLPLRSM